MGNILITGASGFVGMALASRLMRSGGNRIVSMVRDRTSEPPGHAVVHGDVRIGDFCQRVIADYEIDTVYHLAAQAIVSACAEDPLTALDVAAMGTARLLHSVRDAGRPIRVVVSTSDKVYGLAPAPYTEQTPLDARHAYEVSKACQDLIARMYATNYGVDVRVVRAVNIYGPGDPNETRLIPRTAMRLLRGEPPLLHAGAADMRRQYVYIDDMVDGLICVCQRGTAGEAYCLGSPDQPLSVLDVMTALAACTGRDFTQPEIRERESRFHEIETQAVSDNRLRALGWAPAVSFEDGIRQTMDWYRERHKQTSAERAAKREIHNVIWR